MTAITAVLLFLAEDSGSRVLVGSPPRHQHWLTTTSHLVTVEGDRERVPGRNLKFGS